jgi:hypothetical protein
MCTHTHILLKPVHNRRAVPKRLAGLSSLTVATPAAFLQPTSIQCKQHLGGEGEAMLLEPPSACTHASMQASRTNMRIHLMAYFGHANISSN